MLVQLPCEHVAGFTHAEVMSATLGTIPRNAVDEHAV
jgi:hypothetical protein